MPHAEHRITRDDIMDVDAFAQIRAERRKELLPFKKLRRIDVGPVCTFYFESYDTMLFQIHEMLHIERGGDAQIADELDAYNPLVPRGSELVATVMFEINDPVKRLQTLLSLTHIEKHLFVKIADDTVYCVAEEDVERTGEDGKTSSVHFVRFPLTAAQKAAFADPDVQVIVGTDHENYAHMAVLSQASRDELAKDLT